ncbi:hypothetical protein LCGC14_3163190 [marine sediment metagenome]|uniref:Uncharacterized protein n=1 Tax=marine sediment metagenome TaxID=412755 RepID=A0A0F8VQJ6_9ZZZZ
MKGIEYDIEGKYNGNWEVVACEDTFLEARRRIKEYNDNEPGTSFRINRIRIKGDVK